MRKTQSLSHGGVSRRPRPSGYHPGRPPSRPAGWQGVQYDRHDREEALGFAADALNALTQGHHRAQTALDAFEPEAERGFQGAVEALEIQSRRDQRRIADANRLMRELSGEPDP